MLRTLHPIRTDRLTLRPFHPDDLEDVHAYQSLPQVARYLYWNARDREQVREALERTCRETALARDGDWLTLAVVWREVDTVIGEVGLKLVSEEDRQGEVGYIFDPRYQGRGLATEATEAMLRMGLEEAGLHRITGRCDARNGPSIRVLERLGMRREAHFVQKEFVKGEWCDELVHALLQDEWSNRTSPKPTPPASAAPSPPADTVRRA